MPTASVALVRPPFHGSDTSTLQSNDGMSALPATSQRLAFLDFARVLAIFMMIQGHVLDALLSVDYRTTIAFYVWSFLRGLTSCLFLVLAGFVFTVTAYRKQPQHASVFGGDTRRLRRSAVLLAAGYLLHFPTSRLAELRSVSDGEWQAFLSVDILQCIAVTLCLLQVLFVLTRIPTRFTFMAGIACVAVVVMTPVVWRNEASDWLPLGVTSYLSSRSGSLFPLLPWASYMLLGAVLGGRYQRTAWTPGSFADRELLPCGLLMIGTSLVCQRLPFEPFGPTDFWSTSPNQFLMRAGLVLGLLVVAARVSQLLSRGRPFVQSVAQESLLVYVVHLCLVYGSRWNSGLLQFHGSTTSLALALVYAATLSVAMALLAVGWNRLKASCPRHARWVRLAVATVVIGTLA